jgi:carbamoyl-phosphate synthase large subunit
MNPRVSRSSALASKATGFPIAKVAALLAIGYSLDEIKNDITKVTPASFEPTIDYIVTKIPRFTFEKFNDAKPVLSSTMHSVGEAMSMGRSFAESLQKALYSMEIGLSGFNEPKIDGVSGENNLQQNQEIIKRSLESLSPDRILKIAHALRYNISVEEVCAITKYDPWFIKQIKQIIDVEENIKATKLPSDKISWLNLKKLGFSDKRLSELGNVTVEEIQKIRKNFSIYPVYKRVDTCAAEFKSYTPYMYSCYEGDGITDAECEADPSDKDKIIILGGGPNRIGQGIEFDYACVHAAYSLSDAGYETIMINCNPETVSTDYDTSDRLYFEPLSPEHVINIVRKEQQKGKVVGVLVQFGGQTALKLAKYLDKANIPIIGTSYDKIDLAEDRERFQKLLHQIDLVQPNNIICNKLESVKQSVDQIGYPVVIRPSNVLGGRAMEIIYNADHLQKYLNINNKIILDGPILIDKFLNNAIEIDVDALCDGDDVYIAGIMEHIEEAGIHSGDSACSIPPYSLSEKTIKNIKDATTKLAKKIGVIGLMNIQYAVKEEQLYVIEVNPRASRTVPFVAKATGVNIAKIASLIMVGKKLSEFDLTTSKNDYYSVKEVVFPFARFSNTDILLGPEMRSTGEVMGIDKSFSGAFLKAQIAAGNDIITSGAVLISVKDADKNTALLTIAEKLIKCDFKIYATKGTAKFLQDNNLTNITVINKEYEGGYHIIQLVKDKKVNLVINTTIGSDSIAQSVNFRRTVIMNRVFHFTTIAAAKCFINSIESFKHKKSLDIVCLQSA